MRNIAILPMVIAFIALIIIAVVFIIYKLHIKRVLSGQQRATHTNVPSPTNIATIIVVIVLFVWVWICMSKISGLSGSIYDFNNGYNANIEQLIEQISDLKQQIKKQNSLLSYFDSEFGNVNADDNTVEIIFKAVPKTYSENTAMQLRFGEKTIELKKDNNNMFKGVYTADMFTDYDAPVLTIKDGNNIQTVEMDEEEQDYLCGYLWSSALPDLSYIGGATEEHSWNNGVTVVPSIHLDSIIEPDDDTIESLRVVLKVNGETVEDKDVTSEFKKSRQSERLNDDNAVYEDDDKYSVDFVEKLKESDTLIVTLIAKDSLGYTIEYSTCEYGGDDYEIYMNQYKVTDKTGKLVYEGD